ncbi:ribose 5-phosphate isomerase B [bacterium]|jgi:ribose 5-phosphate isomerase B|nr:ribose 5-phosphate isomerase B [bacterium]
MKIVLGSDHAGFARKEEIKAYLESQGLMVIDVGCFSAERVDYPDFGYAAAKKVASKEADYGIVVCFTGIGIGMAANKVKGVRCATVASLDQVDLTRRHNDANMLAFGAKYVDKDLAFKLIDKFLETPFDGGRHQARVDKLDKGC